MSVKTLRITLAFIIASALPAWAQADAVRSSLNIKDIPGEGAMGEIHLFGWDWGVYRSKPTPTGGGGEYKTGITDLTVTKPLDRASSILGKAAASGRNLPEVTLTVRRTDHESTELTLKDVVITSVRRLDGGKENITIQFKGIHIDYETLEGVQSVKPILKSVH